MPLFVKSLLGYFSELSRPTENGDIAQSKIMCKDFQRLQEENNLYFCRSKKALMFLQKETEKVLKGAYNQSGKWVLLNPYPVAMILSTLLIGSRGKERWQHQTLLSELFLEWPG